MSTEILVAPGRPIRVRTIEDRRGAERAPAANSGACYDGGMNFVLRSLGTLMITLAKVFSVTGLFLDIVGVWLLIRNELYARRSEIGDTLYFIGHDKSMRDIGRQIKARMRGQRTKPLPRSEWLDKELDYSELVAAPAGLLRRAHLGLWLIVSGFGLQMGGTLLS